jgi:hypothetical protein
MDAPGATALLLRDDTARLQALLDAGGNVRVPEGVYRVSAPLTFRGTNRVLKLDDNAHLRARDCDPVLVVDGTDLRVFGGSVEPEEPSGGVGVLCAGTGNQVMRVRAARFRHAVRVVGDTCRVYKCFFSRMAAAVVLAGNFDIVDDCTFDECAVPYVDAAASTRARVDTCWRVQWDGVSVDTVEACADLPEGAIAAGSSTTVVHAFAAK